MRRLLPLALLLCGLAAAAPGASSEKPRSHGNGLSGTITRVDEAAKTFVVRTAAGKETALVRTTATKINGEALKAGDRVAVRWLERDGKKIATSIRIEPPAVAAETPAAPTPSTR